jgi:hypothetical protein
MVKYYFLVTESTFLSFVISPMDDSFQLSIFQQVRVSVLFSLSLMSLMSKVSSSLTARVKSVMFGEGSNTGFVFFPVTVRV